MSRPLPRLPVALACLLVACGLVASGARAATAPTPPPPATTSAAAPAVEAPSAIVMEASTGDVAYAKDADARREIASTTKLMTALITIEHARLSAVFPASDYRPAPIESQLGLIPGERMTVADLLRGLMLESGNDAAMTLAEGVAGSESAFVRLMNRKARELGLHNTHFANPIGLDSRRNYSSARDLATLTLTLRRSSFIRTIANRTVATLKSGDHPRTVENRNTLLRTGGAWVNGMKTGHTSKAGYALVGSGTRHGVTLVSVVLDDPDEAARDTDSLALLQWGMNQYERITPVVGDRLVSRPAIKYRRGATLNLITDGTVKRVVRRGTRPVVRDVGVPSEVKGPIRRGQRFGYREVLVNGQRIAAVPIEAETAVPAAGFGQRTKDLFTRPLPIALVILALSASVMLIRRARRGPPRRGRSTQSEPEAA